jgi:hypothetical protein
MIPANLRLGSGDLPDLIAAGIRGDANGPTDRSIFEFFTPKGDNDRFLDA